MYVAGLSSRAFAFSRAMSSSVAFAGQTQPERQQSHQPRRLVHGQQSPLPLTAPATAPELSPTWLESPGRSGSVGGGAGPVRGAHAVKASTAPSSPGPSGFKGSHSIEQCCGQAPLLPTRNCRQRTRNHRIQHRCAPRRQTVPLPIYDHAAPIQRAMRLADRPPALCGKANALNGPTCTGALQGR